MPGNKTKIKNAKSNTINSFVEKFLSNGNQDHSKKKNHQKENYHYLVKDFVITAKLIHGLLSDPKSGESKKIITRMVDNFLDNHVFSIDHKLTKKQQESARNIIFNSLHSSITDHPVDKEELLEIAALLNKKHVFKAFKKRLDGDTSKPESKILEKEEEEEEKEGESTKLPELYEKLLQEYGSQNKVYDPKRFKIIIFSNFFDHVPEDIEITKNEASKLYKKVKKISYNVFDKMNLTSLPGNSVYKKEVSTITLGNIALVTIFSAAIGYLAKNILHPSMDEKNMIIAGNIINLMSEIYKTAKGDRFSRTIPKLDYPAEIEKINQKINELVTFERVEPQPNQKNQQQEYLLEIKPRKKEEVKQKEEKQEEQNLHPTRQGPKIKTRGEADPKKAPQNKSEVKNNETTKEHWFINEEKFKQFLKKSVTNDNLEDQFKTSLNNAKQKQLGKHRNLKCIKTGNDKTDISHLFELRIPNQKQRLLGFKFKNSEGKIELVFTKYSAKGLHGNPNKISNVKQQLLNDREKYINQHQPNNHLRTPNAEQHNRTRYSPSRAN